MTTINQADADAIADRVNCFGIGAWLLALLAQLGAQPPGALAAPRTRVPLSLPQAGLSLQLFRRNGPGGVDWAEEIVLERVTFAAARSALPFNLDSQTETPASARAKLSANMTGPGARMGYVLDDARIVELTFLPSSLGLHSVVVARLGSELDYTQLSVLFSPTNAHP